MKRAHMRAIPRPRPAHRHDMSGSSVAASPWQTVGDVRGRGHVNVKPGTAIGPWQPRAALAPTGEQGCGRIMISPLLSWSWSLLASIRPERSCSTKLCALYLHHPFCFLLITIFRAVRISADCLQTTWFQVQNSPSPHQTFEAGCDVHVHELCAACMLRCLLVPCLQFVVCWLRKMCRPTTTHAKLQTPDQYHDHTPSRHVSP